MDVLQSTQFTAGEGVLLDTTRFGRIAVKESLAMRVFTSNVGRSMAEERLNVAVEWPAAISHITGLPSAAPLQGKLAKASK